MFVYNNCASDARVLKEAGTLLRAGYAVTVFAVLDKQTLPYEDRDGIEIRRINRNPPHYKLLRAMRRMRRFVRLSRARWRRRRARATKRARRWARAGGRRPSKLAPRARGVVPRRAVALLVPAVRWRLTRLVPPLRGPLRRVDTWALLQTERRSYIRQAALLRSEIDALVAGIDLEGGDARDEPPHEAGPPHHPVRAAPRTWPAVKAVDRRVSSVGYRFVMRFHKPLLYLDWYYRVGRAARDREFDTFHAHDLNTLPIATLLARRVGARLVYDAHELYPEVSTLSKREAAVWRLLERRLIGRADHVLTVGQSIADELRRRYGIDPPQIILNCPAAVATKRADPMTLRARAGLAGDERPVILYQGGFAPYRGLEQLVEAAKELRAATVVLMGWGRLEETLRDQVVRSGLSDVVRIIEPVPPDQLLEFTAGADVGVIPYRPVGLNNTFTTPNKLFEYIAAGLAIAASRLPELVRFVERPGLGATFDPETPSDIARVLNQLTEDPARLEAIRKRTAAMRNRFTWEHEAQLLLDVYAKPS